VRLVVVLISDFLKKYIKMAYSQEELNNIVNSLIIDNNTNQVTPAKVREVFNAVISSLPVSVASVTATPPLYIDGFTSIFSILKTDAETNGYLSKEDWILFTNKLSDVDTEGMFVRSAGEWVDSLSLPISTATQEALDDMTGGSQTLQETIDNGNIAEVDGGNSSINFLSGSENSREINLVVYNGGDVTTENSSSFFMQNTTLELNNTLEDNKGSGIILADGAVKLIARNNLGSSTTLHIPSPIDDVTTVATDIYLPLKTTSENYTLATLDDIKLKQYTVSTLPIGVQGDTAYVTDALIPTYLVAVVGGGAVVTPVFYNGTDWVAY